MEGEAGDGGGTVKSYLYAWLSKKKLAPDYSVRPTGPKHRLRFLCELRVPTFNYTGNHLMVQIKGICYN